MKTLYIIAGCNGAGKTTAAMTLLPEIWKCCEYIGVPAREVFISLYNEPIPIF